MRSFNTLLLFAAFLPPVVFAQRSKPDSAGAWAPKAILKISPLHLLNFYPSLQVACEYRVAARVSLQSDVGWVFNTSNGNMRFLDKRGVKVKQDVRYYLSPVKTNSNAHYLSMEYYGHFINFDREAFGRGCFDLDCTNEFRQRYFFTVRYREQGIGFRYGLHYFQKRFDFDLSFGYLFRLVRYHQPVIPGEFGQGVAVISIFPNETNRFGFSPTVGVRVGYCL